MRALTLVVFDLKRLLRHRALALFLIAVPLVVGLMRIAFSDSAFARESVWPCPLACVVLATSAFYMRRLLDRASGFSDALRVSPVSDRTLLISRIIAPVAVLAFQIAAFVAVSSLR